MTSNVLLIISCKNIHQNVPSRLFQNSTFVFYTLRIPKFTFVLHFIYDKFRIKRLHSNQNLHTHYKNLKMTVWQMSDQRKHAPDLSCVSRNLKRDVQTFEGKTMSNCMWTIPLVCWRLHDKCALQHIGYTY